MLDLLGRCNEIGTMGGFVEITLNDKDLDAGSNVSIFNCEKVPKTKQRFDLNVEIVEPALPNFFLPLLAVTVMPFMLPTCF